jgi:hypothetical protein
MVRKLKLTRRAHIDGAKSPTAKASDSPRVRNGVRAAARPTQESAQRKGKSATPARNALRPSTPRRAERPVVPEVPASALERPTARPESAVVPPEVRARFVQVGRKYYFADGAHAFTDRGRRLTTPSENTEVIRSLVQIAQARDWTDITVSGTERFRKEAWMAARSVGLAVRGYRPTSFEQERLVRALARRDAPPVSERVGREASESSPGRAHASADPLAAEAPDRSESRLITGRLVDYGRAPYKHDPHERVSYFVKLETGRAERTLWGVDLERAMRESLTGPQLGDEIGVQSLGQEAVVVRSREHDAQGRVVSEKPLDTHRNRWIVEKREFFHARAAAAETIGNDRVRASDGVRQHPELTGTYLYLKSAEEFAKQKIRDPLDQKRFVATVRQALAQSVARGDPLAPVRLRELKASKRTSEPAKRHGARKPDLVRE